MGWTSLYRRPGITDRAWFEQEFRLGRDDSKQEILDCATVRNVFYAAVRNKDDGKVWALVVLIQRGRGDFNFSYKDMDESMGPNEARCPERILDLLSPTDNKYAQEWRQACRDYHAGRAARPKVTVGSTVRFEHPLNFSNGDTVDTFTFVGGSKFRASGQLYRIPSWRDRQHEVIPA